MEVAIVSASTRVNRLSDRVALALEKELQLNDIKTTILDLGLMDIPLFTEMLSEQSNPNPDLVRFNQVIQDAQGILFISPEYNGSYTPALKNAVDHLDETTFRRKVIGVVSVSAGKLGGMRGALQMQNLILGLWGYPIPHMLLVSNIESSINSEGRMQDPLLRTKANNFLDDFAWLTKAVSQYSS